MSKTGLSFSIFIPSGNSHGARLITKANWIGEAVAFQMRDWDDVKKWKELKRTGVYILWDRDERAPNIPVYVGESGQIQDRLSVTKSDAEEGTPWDRCTDVLVFTSKDDSLDKATVLYLEARLYELAKRGRRCRVLNKQKPTGPNLLRNAKTGADLYLKDLLQCLTLLGVSCFQVPNLNAEARNRGPLLMLEAGGLRARAQWLPDGLLVLKGSQARNEPAPSLNGVYVRERESLIESSVLVMDGDFYRFDQDYLFSAPSRATSVICGVNGGGLDLWQDDKGKTLRSYVGGR